MAHGAVRNAPFGAIRDIFGWISSRERWHFFHGWCLARGVKPLALEAHAFLDLAHYYMVKTIAGESEEDAVRINQELIGNPIRREVIPGHSEAAQRIPQPSWWRGMDKATIAGLAAIDKAQSIKHEVR
jgi:hypothetical protein